MAFATTYTPPGTNADQRFKYTCTGAEGDVFTLTLPAARVDVNYIAQVSLLFGTGQTQYICNGTPR